jgi:hypothetical protein
VFKSDELFSSSSLPTGAMMIIRTIPHGRRPGERIRPLFHGGSIDRIGLLVNAILAAISKARMLALRCIRTFYQVAKTGKEDLTGAFCMNMIPITV